MAGVVNLAGKIALITGASSGIGRGTSILFSRLGAQVVATGRKEDNLKKTAELCTAEGKIKPHTIVGDVTDEKDAQKMVKETVEKFGKLDVLINSAGVIEFGSIENTSLEQYDRVMNINVRSIYHLSILAVPHLIKTKGNIVNVSSVNGIRAFTGLAAYNVSKSAVDQLTRCAALDLAAEGVRVNCVNPGVIITELQKRGGLDEEAYEKFLERSKQTHALGRPGQVEEAAATIAFLASNAASFITGVSLPVDGGRHAMCPR